MNFDTSVARATTDEGVRYYVAGERSQSRETVVLLHGTGGTAHSNFWALLPMLATRHRVVTLDFADEWNEAPSGLDAYVEQARSVLRAASSGDVVHLLGYSFGAVIAAVLAAREPRAVRSLVLLAGWMRTDDHQRLRNDIWTSLSAEEHPALASFMAFTAFSPQYLRARTPEEISTILSGFGDVSDRRHKMLFNCEVDITGDVGKIAAPTLVVGCRDDQMVPVHHSRLLFGAIADARYAEVASGHAVLQERPSELLRLCDQFIAEPHRRLAGVVIPSVHA